jgi:hypothetical protein
MEYSYSEAIILRKYYLEKLIGKKVNDSFENTISEIAIKELPNGKYVVTPGFWYENRDFIFLEINKHSTNIIPRPTILRTEFFAKYVYQIFYFELLKFNITLFTFLNFQTPFEMH